MLVADGRILEVGPGLQGDRTLDAAGCVVAPGLVDLHVHLREPGGEDAETIETGARAAALGGFSAVVAMPNTDPAQDDPAVVASVLAAGARSSCDVHAAGCITRGRAGEVLAPMGELFALGVRMFTDDGACVADAGVMRRALEYSRSLPGAVLAQHAEDPALAGGGHMHEGEWSSRLGIPGRPAAAESVIVARDCMLAALTGARVHFLHVSTAAAVELVRDAKARGLAVTAEAAPHHFTLTDADCATFDPVYKVHPPLRSPADVEAIKAGLADGTIDAIATDHAPHDAVEGAAVRGSAARHARPGDGARVDDHRARRARCARPRRRDCTAVMAARGDRRARRSRRADRTRKRGEPVRLRPQHSLGGLRGAAREQGAQHAVRRSSPHRARSHTIVRGEAVVIDGQAVR